MFDNVVFGCDGDIEKFQSCWRQALRGLAFQEDESRIIVSRA